MRKQRRQRGFTLIELLATVAITVVFLAFSVLAVGSYQSQLKITELDNAARQIYLAAQNRAVLLRSRGALEQMLTDDGISLTAADAGDGSKLFYITNTEPDKAEVLDQLLPVGTIDPSLREGQFYIVYEPDSGSVTDAFYMENGRLEEGFPLYYATHPISAEDRRQDDPMVGWYSGEPAVAGDASDQDAPEIKIFEILNEDTLRAEITWTIPKEQTKNRNAMHLQVTAAYNGREDAEVLVPETRRIFFNDSIAENGGISVSEVYLLDSLVPGMQFKDLFPDVSGLSFGGEFTLRAQVVYDGTSYIPQPVEKTANSLFADDTDGTTAHISYLRHLQNLHPGFSGVDGITSAIQDEDIGKPSDKTGYILDDADPSKYAPQKPDYNFTPISNDDLTSYDGQTKEIRWLYSTGSVNAGLFSKFSGSLKDIRLMNAYISGTENVGALCGEAWGGVEVNGCQVYWKAETSGAADLRDLLGEADGTYAFSQYKITGETAGGLIGYANSNNNNVDITIANSSASTTVRGTTVGGMVGRGENKLTIKNSYADCYLKGTSVGGMVGTLASNFTLDNVYTAGFVSMDDGDSAAGLFLKNDWGGNITNSYAAMAYSSTENVYPLAQNGNFGGSVYYLGSLKSNNGGKSFTSAEELSGLPADFVKAPKTYAYNLRPDVTLGNYPYPGLAGLDHYGDWLAASKPEKGNRLVYWERYTDGKLGIWGSLGKYLRTDADENALVVTDSYALLLEESDFINGSVTVNYFLNYETNINEYEESKTYYLNDGSLDKYEIDGTTYYLAELPARCYTDTTFYGEYRRLHKLNVTIGISGSGTYWYDPLFAKLPIESDTEPDSDGTASVRSARHLYNLGRYDYMYGGRKFQQELNIDYSIYKNLEGAAFENYFKNPLPPIDFLDTCTYDGMGHWIRNIPLYTDGSNDIVYTDDIYKTDVNNTTGLFNSNGGEIRNLFYGGTGSDDIVTIDGSKKSSVGSLVGVSSGKIINCAVNYVSINSTVDGSYVGGLVGENSGGTINGCVVGNVSISSTGEDSIVGGLTGSCNGFISNCAVGYVTLESKSTSATAGGLVGSVSGEITNCYASTDSITAIGGNACGFAGYSDAIIQNCYAISRIDAGNGTAAGFAVQSNNNISNSYAAADVSGGTKYPFASACGDNCYYLDKGEYLDVPFTAPNLAGGGMPKTWGELTGSVDSLFEPQKDPEGKVFRFGCLDDESEHRLPAIVKDANDNYFHYGSTVYQVPDTMPMGVYYWEKEGSGYHFRVVSYDPASGKYSEVPVNNLGLCTEHDGGIITDYGYGWFKSPALTGWKFSSEGIAYDGEADWYEGGQLGDVNKALSDLLGAYMFHSFPAASNGGTGGLSLDGSSINGKWTISSSNGESGHDKAVFEIDPFFANAINYDNTGSDMPSGLGTSTPYEIRSIRQLQFINWNTQSRSCTTHVEAGNGDQFLFLNREDLSFRQTHDLDGKVNGGAASFFSIAAFLDSTGGGITDVPAAFCGRYDGQSYVIRNICFGGNDMEANTLGLFGTTVNARLENIILYCTASLDIYNYSKDSYNFSNNNGWYYVGPLAGLAMQTHDGAYITNCASAGFTIKDSTQNPGRYGGNIGGLVGAANVPISRCTAVNDIKLEYSRNSSDPNGIRVGGLVGACESSIRSCYSGGSISVSTAHSSENMTGGSEWSNYCIVSLYIGRISGGVDTKLDIGTLYPNGETLTVNDCYSYVTLPEQLQTIDNSLLPADSRTRELYNIAGDAELTPSDTFKYITVENSYYLIQSGFSGSVTPGDDDTWTPPERTGITGLNYDEMASGLFSRLNGFGSAVDSNSPDNNDAGKLYPFPAVLKTVDTDTFVHYGKLPVRGLASASAAMTVDLFADYDAGTGTVYQDDLVWASRDLAAHMPGGQFRPELTRVVNAEGDENAEPVCEAAFVDESDAYPAPGYGQRILRVTFLRPGDAEVTVYYGQPWADIADCVALTIPVTDTAELHMQPADTAVSDGGLEDEAAAYAQTTENVTAFTGADTELELYPFDKNNKPITPELEEKLSVTVTGFGSDGVSLIAAAPTVDIAPDFSETDAPAVIMLDGAAATDGARTMTVDYSYTIEGIDGSLTGSDDILYEVKDLAAEPGAIVFVRRDGVFTPDSVTYGPEDILFTVDGEAVSVEDLRITNAVSPSGAVAFSLSEDGSVTAAPGNESGSYAMEQTQLDLTFTYGPASHTVSVSPPVCFYEDGMDLHFAGDTINDDGSMDLYTGTAEGPAALALDEPADGEPVPAEAFDMPEDIDMPAAAAVEPISFEAETPVTTPVSPEDNGAAPGAGTPVHVQEYLDGDWSVQWSLEGAVAPYVSIMSDGGTAWLAVTGMPETNMTEGTLTVTVTLPEPWLGVTFTGSIPVHIINESAPSPTPEPTPAPEATPVPENTAPPVEEVTPAPPVQEPEWQPEPEPEPDWQPEWEPEPVPDAPDVPDFLPEEELIPW